MDNEFCKTHLAMYRLGNRCPFCSSRNIRFTKANEIRWCADCGAVARQSSKATTNNWIWASMYEIKEQET